MASQTTSTKIKETITKIVELEAVQRHFDTTLEELEAVLTKKDKIESQMIKELEDINKLEKLGVKSIFYKVLGSKEEQLEKERQEYLQVTLQHKELLNALEVVNFEKDLLEKKLVAMDDLLKTLENLKEIRASEILSSASPLRNELILIHKKSDELRHLDAELQEALNAGANTLSSLSTVHKHLRKAKEWGDWDMMGGNNGRYHKSMKHNAIDRAMGEISRTKLFLRTLNKELNDVGYSNQRLGLSVDNIARFPGVIFDNLISDWIVQNKIKGVLATINNLIDDVKLMMKSIERDKTISLQELQGLQDKLNNILETR